MHPLKPQIVERVFHIPVQGLGRRTRRYERADHICSVSLLFGIYLAQIIDWSVRCDDRNAGRNNRASFGVYLYRLAALNFLCLRSAKQLAVQALDRTRKTCQILQRMELRLPCKAE